MRSQLIIVPLNVTDGKRFRYLVDFIGFSSEKVQSFSYLAPLLAPLLAPASLRAARYFAPLVARADALYNATVIKVESRLLLTYYGAIF